MPPRCVEVAASAAVHTAPSTTASAAGLLSTSTVLRHPAAARVDPHHRPVPGVGHPDAVSVGRDSARLAPDPHGLGHLGVRVDPRHGPVAAVGHPDRAGADGDAAGSVAHRDPGQRRPRARVEPDDARRGLARDPDRPRPRRQRRRSRLDRDRLRGLAARRSIRTTVASTADATQTAPEPTATASAALPTAMRCTTLLICGSIWATVRPWPSATHSDPAPNASPVGSPPTSIVTTSRRARLIRDTVPSSRLATHTEPAPAATASGPCPTGYWAVIRPLSGSISPTAFSSMPARLSGSSTRMTPKASDAGDQQRSGGDEQHRSTTAARRRRAASRSGAAAPGRSSAGSCARIASWSRRSSRAGLDADLLDQHRARLAVGLRAPPTGGRRDTARACAARAAAHAADARRSAPRARRSPRRAAGREVGVDRLSVARRRSSSRRRISAAANGSSATSASASPRQSASASRGRVLDQALEADRVHLAVGELQLVAAAAGDDRGAVALEQPAQVRDIELHHLRRAGRRLLAPQSLGETVGRDRATDLAARASRARPAACGGRARWAGRRVAPRAALAGGGPPWRRPYSRSQAQ